MYRGRVAAFVAAIIGVLPASFLDAQVASRTISSPDATFPEAFSSIGGLREMPDGRLLVADPLGSALLLVDMAAGRVDTLGRTGGGPEEYRQPDALFALPGDSTLMVDLGNARLTAVAADGQFGGTEPMTRGEPGTGQMLIIVPRAVDAEGRLYFQAMGGFRMGAGPPDSAAVVRWDRSSESMDTVGMVKLQDRDVSESGGPNNRNVRMMAVPMSPQDGWAVARDGSMALVRAGDYHVEWVHPGGRVVRGEPVEYDPIGIGRAEKEDWIQNSRGSGLQVMISMDNGRRQTSFSRGGGGGGGGGGSGPALDEYSWPDEMPAFQANRVYVSPEGNLWVQRWTKAGSPPTFDVFDANGNLEEQIVLPAGRRIVGFGASTVYLAAVDEFDLQYLERYRTTS